MASYITGQLRSSWIASLCAIACLGQLLPNSARAQTKIIVPADAEWFDTGIFVDSGDNLFFSGIQGRWLNVPGTPNLGPTGWGSPHEGTYLPSAPLGGLIASVGSEHANPFYIDVNPSADRASFRYQSPGRGNLYLTMNDVRGTYTDNPGSMEVSVSVRPNSRRTMPALRGLTLDQAVTVLRRYDLAPPNSYGRGYSQFPAGQIYEQTPPAGTAFPLRVPVTLAISDGTPPEPLPMPDLTGRTPAAAEQFLLERYHLSVRKPYRHSYHDSPAGQIFDQEPKAGAPVNPNVPVMVSVSDGPVPQRRVKVPKLENESEDLALKKLREAGLRGRPSSKREDSPRPAGTVLRSDPSEGTFVEAGSAVVYWTASGRNIVPDVLGRTQEAANAILAQAGFRLGGVSEEYNPARVEVVASSSPSAGTLAELNAPVALVLGTDLIEVPDVRTMPLKEAEDLLHHARFLTSTESNFGLSAPGKVLQQHPASKAKARVGDTIILTTSKLYLVVLLVAAAVSGAFTLLPPRVTVFPHLSVDAGKLSPDGDAQVSGPDLSLEATLSSGAAPGEFSVPITKETLKEN